MTNDSFKLISLLKVEKEEGLPLSLSASHQITHFMERVMYSNSHNVLTITRGQRMLICQPEASAHLD